MGLVYLPTLGWVFYDFHVGKYTVRPMDPSWDNDGQVVAKDVNPTSEVPWIHG